MRTLQLGILAAAVAGMATLIGCESIKPMGPSLVDQHMGEAVAGERDSTDGKSEREL